LFWLKPARELTPKREKASTFRDSSTRHDAPPGFTLRPYPHIDGIRIALGTMLSHLHDRRPPAGRTRPARLEICPPQRHRAPQHWLGRVKRWLVAGWPGSDTPATALPDRSQALADARQDFFVAAADLKLPAAAALLDRIEYAKSMRELWHLRAEVFALVSLELNQLEADRRLAALNRHFPTRAPRSGFVGLQAGKDMWP
jgi:hypothetical protein